MFTDRYVVLEAPRAAAAGASFGIARFDASFLPAKIRAEDLTSGEVAEVARAPGVLAAPVMPLQLVLPVEQRDVADNGGADGASWGVTAVGAAESPFTGNGVRVAVLDTGIDRSHPAFAGVTITEEDFTGDGNGDQDGHGTHCAATIVGRDVDGFRVGVAPGVTDLFVGKVLGTGATTESLVNGIQWALKSGASVVSMSLGIDFPGAVARLAERGLPVAAATSQALEAYRQNVALFDALAELFTNGALGWSSLVLAASGNESRRGDRNAYTIAVAPPAVSRGVIAVGAVARGTGADYPVASFSNTNPAIVGPGVEIVSAKAGGGLVAMSGTSMATPHAAGVAALWAESLLTRTNEIDISILQARLVGTSRPLAGSAVDVGAGLVQAPAGRT